MKTTTIYEQVFLHHQCARRESHCYKISLFQQCLSLLYKKRNLIKLIVFFLILHVVNSDNFLFTRNNNVFLLIFRIKYVKHLCNS
jgi:hypothetical protein